MSVRKDCCQDRLRCCDRYHACLFAVHCLCALLWLIGDLSCASLQAWFAHVLSCLSQLMQAGRGSALLTELVELGSSIPASLQYGSESATASAPVLSNLSYFCEPGLHENRIETSSKLRAMDEACQQVCSLHLCWSMLRHLCDRYADEFATILLV